MNLLHHRAIYNVRMKRRLTRFLFKKKKIRLRWEGKCFHKTFAFHGRNFCVCSQNFCTKLVRLLHVKSIKCASKNCLAVLKYCYPLRNFVYVCKPFVFYRKSTEIQLFLSPHIFFISEVFVSNAKFSWGKIILFIFLSSNIFLSSPHPLRDFVHCLLYIHIHLKVSADGSVFLQVYC